MRSTIEVQFGLSPDERQVRNDARLETLTYTLLGEARGEGVEGMVAVANVIKNRANSGIYSSDPVEVVLQPWQFSTHNTKKMGGGNQAQTRREVPPGSPLYNQAKEIAKRYVLGDGIDITGGSLFYHVSGLDWRYADSATGPYGTHQIGHHTFYPRHPVPKVNIGDADYLAGFTQPAPLPLPRSARPNPTAPVNAGTIREIQRQVAVQRAVAARDMATASRQPLPELGDLAITPRLGADGEVIEPLPQPKVLFDARATPVGGLGSLLGKAFPMVPTDRDMIAALPTEVRGPSAPGAGLTVAERDAIRRVPTLRVAEAPDEIDEAALVTRVVRTVAIDPRTGSPILTSTEAGTAAPRQFAALPVGHGRPSPRTPAQFPPDRLSPNHNANDPSEQIASRGRVGAAMRSRQPPVPLPASARPPSLAERVKPLSFPMLDQPKAAPVGHGAPKPKPLGTPPNVSAALPRPTQTSDATMRNAISALPKPASGQQRVTTQIVRPDGSVSNVPLAGSNAAPIPRPSSLRPAAAPVGHGAPRPKKAPAPAAATVKPQQPGALTPPTQTINPTMRNAISAVGGVPVPAQQVVPPPLEAPVALPVEAPIAAPAAPPPPRRVSTRSVVVPTPPPKPTIVGSHTGRRYEVGGVFLGGGGRYAYEAQANGTFKKIASVDRTAEGLALGEAARRSPEPTYTVHGDNMAFQPTSVQNSERQRTGY